MTDRQTDAGDLIICPNFCHQISRGRKRGVANVALYKIYVHSLYFTLLYFTLLYLLTYQHVTMLALSITMLKMSTSKQLQIADFDG